MPKGIIIRSGSVRVRIFPSRSGKYVRHEIRWTDHHGRRRRQKLSNAAAARKEAQRLADDLARGHHHAELSLADLASFRAGIVNLYGCGKTLELATAEYAAGRRVLAAAGLANEQMPAPEEMAKAWLDKNRQDNLRLNGTASEHVAQFLLTKQAAGISARWAATLGAQLARFAADHPGPVARLTAEQIQHWHLHLNTKPVHGRSKPMHPRSRNNHLLSVQSLFQSPALRGHPQRDAILDLAPIAHGESERIPWRPEEFQNLLRQAPDHLLPVLVLGGFAAVRAAEIRRLDWSQIRLDDAQLRIYRQQAKTLKRRLVPLPENAVEWLRKVARPDGKVWPWAVTKFSRDLTALARRCGYQWRENALRKSAITYRELLDCDTAANARAAGNSREMIEAEYLAFDNVTRSDAKAWFEIRPPAQERVIVPLTARK